MNNNEIYWSRYEASSSIERLNPDVAELTINATPVYNGHKREDLGFNMTVYPDHKYMLRLKCPNIDCDNGYIDLSDEIWNAVKSGKASEGRKRCSGHLKKYSHNKSAAFDCEAYVEYQIMPVLRTRKDDVK